MRRANVEVAHLQCHKGHLRVICIPSLFLLLDQFSLRTFGQPQGCAPIPHNQAKSRDNIFQSLLNKFQQGFFSQFVLAHATADAFQTHLAVAQSRKMYTTRFHHGIIYPALGDT